MDAVVNNQIIEEAATWFVEFNTGKASASVRSEFDAWLRKSPEHLRAYLEMIPVWEDTALVDRERGMNVDELIALSQTDGNVVILDSQAVRTAVMLKRWTPARTAVAAVVLCACAAGVLIHFYHRSTYSTTIGEQRVVALSDGSHIELNAHSRIKVRYSDTERDVDLLEGQALFRVEKDSRFRPFIVNSGTAHVRALGTQFDVYRKKQGTTITVLEGRVAVTPGGPGTTSAQDITLATSTASAILVSAGEQVVATPVTVSPAAHANVVAATAWRQRRLVFSSTPLTMVAEEFNRYNERQLIVQDPRLDEFLVNGVFSSTDPASLVRFLRAQPDLNIDDTGTDIRVTSK